jgi:lipopolysaccharide export LptBFGC system permease protein LptF
VTVLDRYVARIFAVSLFVSFTFVVALYIAVHFFGHLDDLESAERAFAARGIGLMQGICRYYAISMPFIFAKLGPFSALLAAMWTVQKMSKDQEITAAQVAGVSLHRLMAPVLIVGLLLSLGLWAIRQDVLPRLAVPHQELEWLMRGKTVMVIDGKPLLVRDSAGNRFSIQTYDPTSRTARGVRFRSQDLSRTLDFDEMRYDDANSRWEKMEPGAAPQPIGIETDLAPRDIEIDARGLRFLASDELDELARRLPGRLDLELLRQTRFTFPFTTPVLLLIGLALVLRRDRQSVYAAWGLALLLSLVYIGAENVLHGLAERDGLLSPFLAAWTPIVVFGTVGAMAFQDL